MAAGSRVLTRDYRILDEALLGLLSLFKMGEYIAFREVLIDWGVLR